MSKQSEEKADRPFLIAAEPQLFVSDIAASCAFFTQSLGFSVAFIYGDPPFYAQVARDGAKLNLRHVDHPLIDPALAERKSYLAATVTLAKPGEVRRLFADFQAACVDFQQPLKRQPWGTSDFVVRDPDGNLLCFAAPAD
jgi:catechol 2,3-dioxygenase-like lactoylglutathione lyase family enzyme